MARGVATMGGARRVLAVLAALLLVLGGVPAGWGAGVARAAACVVTNTNDSGAGSLREKMADTNCDSITFQAGVVGTITLAGDLPYVTRTLTVTGPGVANLTVDRGNKQAGYAFLVDPAGDLTLTGLTISRAFGGVMLYAGGNATVRGIGFTDNLHGVFLYQGGTATVAHSTLRGNNYGIQLQQGGAAAVANSTISGSSSAGIRLLQGGVVTVTNSTITGGWNGLFHDGGGMSTVTNSTLAGNFNANLSLWNAGTTTVRNTVVADGGCHKFANVTIIDGGHNLHDGNECGFGSAPGSLANTPAGLDPAGLKDNGGLTQTIALLPTSPAINAGDNAACAAAPVNGVDQRGIARPQGKHCDIGAHELTPVPTRLRVEGAGPYGDALLLSAILTQTGGAGVVGRVVAFAVNGTTVCDNAGGGYPAPCPTTGASGGAALAVALPGIGPGSHPAAVGASFAGDAAYAPSQGSGALSVFPPDCAARFADVANDNPACPAIYSLSQAEVIKGYDTDPPSFGPEDDVQRAQLAGFLVRALGWAGHPTGPRTFSDFDGLVAELRDAVLVLANACAVPADDATCVLRGYGGGAFGPTDPVSHAQVIAIIARAFALDPAAAWVPAPPGCPAAAGVPAVHAAEVCAYVANAGAIPDAPTTPAGWDAPASRAWVALALWQALLTRP